MVHAKTTHKKQFPARLLIDMAKSIVKVSEPQKIILFGSQARGTATEHSDYDFIVIDSALHLSGYSRRKTAAKISWELSAFGVPTDILLFTSEEVSYWSQSLNHVISCALREGIVIYERPNTGKNTARCILSRPESAIWHV